MKKISIFFIVLMLVLMASCQTEKRPENLGELTSQYVTMDDSIRIHYKVYGEGERTLCFVHGFGCDLQTWEPQFEALRQEKMKLVFLDLPGYGESSKPRVDYTLDLFARAIDKVLTQNEVGSVVLIGHSLGTPVCRHYLLKGYKPGYLVDVDGVYCFYDGTETPEYVEAVQGFGHAFDGENCAEVISGFVSSLAGPQTPQSISDYAMQVMPQTPQYVASSTMQHLVERDWWPQTPLETNTLVFCTENSGIDPDNQEKMQRLYPHLDYVQLSTCGHFIHMEQADMFNKKLLEFVANF